MFGSDVASDRSALFHFFRIWRSERDDKNVGSDLGNHQPVGRRLSRIEQRVGVPDFKDIIDTKGCMFEQVRSLSVDFERVVLIECIDIEQFSHLPEV